VKAWRVVLVEYSLVVGIPSRVMTRLLPFVVLSFALVLAPGGCSPPVEVGFDSRDPQGRTIALARAADSDDEASVPEMINLLNSADSAQRMLAIRALERRTGETFGYRHYAPEDERLEAQSRWAEWWDARRESGS